MTPLWWVIGLGGPLLGFFGYVVHKDGWKEAGIVFGLMCVAFSASSLILYLINLSARP